MDLLLWLIGGTAALVTGLYGFFQAVEWFYEKYRLFRARRSEAEKNGQSAEAAPQPESQSAAYPQSQLNDLRRTFDHVAAQLGTESNLKSIPQHVIDQIDAQQEIDPDEESLITQRRSLRMGPIRTKNTVESS